MLIYNATSKNLYSPRNTTTLEKAIAMHGWTSGDFAGAGQWRSMGRKIRPGEQGVPIVIIVGKAVTKDGQQEKITVRKAKYVFNGAQTEPDLEQPSKPCEK